MSESSEDTELRALRAKVYGECTDLNWSEVRKNWSTTEARRWLMDHSRVLPEYPKKQVQPG